MSAKSATKSAARKSAQSTPAVAPAIPANVKVVATIQPHTEVVQLLTQATSGYATVTGLARDAAIKADALDYTNEVPAKRLDLILKLYMPNLTTLAVRNLFSAALAILVADKAVTVVKATKANGDNVLSFPKGTAKEPTCELTPMEAVKTCPSELVKQLARPAREAIGIARATGGGRKAEVKATRAPFMDELAAAWKDTALRAEIESVLRAAGYEVVKIKTIRKQAEQAAAPTLSEVLAA